MLREWCWRASLCFNYNGRDAQITFHYWYNLFSTLLKWSLNMEVESFLLNSPERIKHIIQLYFVNIFKPVRYFSVILFSYYFLCCCKARIYLTELTNSINPSVDLDWHLRADKPIYLTTLIKHWDTLSTQWSGAEQRCCPLAEVFTRCLPSWPTGTDISRNLTEHRYGLQLCDSPPCNPWG